MIACFYVLILTRWEIRDYQSPIATHRLSQIGENSPGVGDSGMKYK